MKNNKKLNTATSNADASVVSTASTSEIQTSTSSKVSTSKNGILYLLRQRFSTMQFHIARIITFVIFFVIFAVVNLISLIWLKSKDVSLISNILIIAASAVAGILMVILSVSMFRGEYKNNQINLELREGYKPWQIYLTRVIDMAFQITVFMILALIVNLVTIAVKGEMNNVVWYHMFVTSLGWYAIICIVAAGMGIFFCGFVNSGWSGTLATLVMLIVIVIGGVIPGVVALNSNSKAGSMDYAGEIAEKKIDNSIINFAKNDLGINNLEDLGNAYSPFLKYVENQVSTKKEDIDWLTYGQMTLGIWAGQPTGKDFDKLNSDSSDVNEYIDQYFSNPNIFASVAAFGNGIFTKENPKPNKQLENFFDNTKKFFANNDKDFKFTDISNWSILDGTPSNKLTNRVYNNVRQRAPRNGQVVVNENFNKLMDDASKSKELGKYSFIKELDKYSNATALSGMFNEHGDKYSNPQGGTNNYLGRKDTGKSNYYSSSSNQSTMNIDYSQNLYPQFGIGGYTTKVTNVQKQIIDLAKKENITPAEFLFNRNIMFWVAKAFEDYNAHATWKQGRTILASDAEYYSDQNVVVLHVNNGFEFRYKNVTYGMSDLQKGTLPKGALNGLAIKINNETYTANDMIDARYLSSFSHGYIQNSGNYINYQDYRNVTDQNVIAFNVKKAPVDTQSGGDYRNGKKIYALVGQVKYSTNPMLMISDTANDLDGFQGGEFSSTFSELNKWLDGEISKSIISKIAYDKSHKKITFNLWNDIKSDPTNNFKGIKLTDNGQVIKGVNWECDSAAGTVTASWNNKASDKLHISFEDENSKTYINTSLIDGSFLIPSFAYKDSETHKSAISWIYNPLTQLQAMFNGVNYKNEAVDNLMTSFINQNYVGINSLNVRISIEPSKTNPYENTMKINRASYVEIVYVYYVFVQGLFIFVGFWMYRKSIVS